MSSKASRKITSDNHAFYPPLVPSEGVSEKWIDQMILAGRLFIGQECDHNRMCALIRRNNKQHLSLVS